MRKELKYLTELSKDLFGVDGPKKDPIESSRKVLLKLALLGWGACSLFDNALLKYMINSWKTRETSATENSYLLLSRNILGMVPPISCGPPANVGVYKSAVLISLKQEKSFVNIFN